MKNIGVHKGLKIFNLLSYTTILLFSMFGFMTGFHDADLGQNLRYINSEYNLTLVDHITMEKSYDPMEEYIYGINLMIKSFFVAILGSLGLGLSIAQVK